MSKEQPPLASIDQNVNKEGESTELMAYFRLALRHNQESQEETGAIEDVLKSIESGDYSKAILYLEGAIQGIEETIKAHEDYIESYNARYPISEEEKAQGVTHPQIEDRKRAIEELKEDATEFKQLKDSIRIEE